MEPDEDAVVECIRCEVVVDGLRVVVVFVDAMNEVFVGEVADKLSKLIVVTIDGTAAVGSAVTSIYNPVVHTFAENG